MTAKSSHNENSDGRLAIIAGYGQLPLDVAIAAQDASENPFIFALQMESDQDWSNFDHIKISIGDFAVLKRNIQQYGIDRIVMAGGVKHRPQITQIKPTLNTLFALPDMIKKVLSGGDDAVLRAVIKVIESQGCVVVGAHQIVPNLLAQEGAIGVIKANAEDQLDINKAAAAAVKIGELDIGQGAVAVGGRVIALEGLEGTDAMLERVAHLRQNGRLAKHKRGVLIKLCKPQQDMRADLPTIGPQSVLNAHAAGLAGIVVEAGRSLILERDKVINLADELNLFVMGITQEELS